MPFFFFFFISKYTEYCHSTGFASFQVSRSLPFLRQGNQDIRSFNYLQIFTEVASGLRQTQSGRNLATAAEFHKKLSVPVGGRLFSGRTFLTFLRPSSVATSFEQIKLPQRTKSGGRAHFLDFLYWTCRPFILYTNTNKNAVAVITDQSPDNGQSVTKAYPRFIWGDIKHF